MLENIWKLERIELILIYLWMEAKIGRKWLRAVVFTKWLIMEG
jgi:hypothetical protein